MMSAPHSMRRDWAADDEQQSDAEYSALAVFLQYLFLAWVACAFAAGLFGWGSAEASYVVWNPWQVEPWTVADTSRDTRPVYALAVGTKAIARAKPGTQCEPQQVRASNLGRAYHLYKTESGDLGAVLCQKP